MFNENKVKALLSEIQSEYDQVCLEKKHVIEKMENWNKDEEIQKAVDRANQIQARLSKGFNPTDSQWDEINKWKESHIKKYHSDGKKTKVGVSFSYSFSHTALGTMGSVCCDECERKAFLLSHGDFSLYKKLKEAKDVEHFIGEVNIREVNKPEVNESTETITENRTKTHRLLNEYELSLIAGAKKGRKKELERLCDSFHKQLVELIEEELGSRDHAEAIIRRVAERLKRDVKQIKEPNEFAALIVNLTISECENFSKSEGKTKEDSNTATSFVEEKNPKGVYTDEEFKKRSNNILSKDLP